MIDEELSKIVKDSWATLETHFKENQREELKYHNWHHTQKVFAYASEFAENTPSLSAEDYEAIQLAALFHDSYFFEGGIDHEQKGANFAEQYLSSQDYPKTQIEKVKSLIMATQMGHVPASPLEEILCDADLSHLAERSYMVTSFKNLYKEMNTLCSIDSEKWLKETVDLFQQHDYHNKYAKSTLTEGKMENQKQLEALLNKDMDNVENEQKEEKDQLKPKPKKKKRDKKKNVKPLTPDKGIETVFRVSLRNHVNLSHIADGKANTLISVNAIIISIVLSTLFPKFDKNQFLMLPGITLMAFSIATIIVSIFSTIPRTTHGLLTREDVKNKRGNLLFFGNFHQMDIKDYEWAMDELMQDRDYLYKSLTRDLFYLGKVLKQKYTFLRIAYLTFVIGLCVSILMFVYSLKQGIVPV